VRKGPASSLNAIDLDCTSSAFAEPLTIAFKRKLDCVPHWRQRRAALDPGQREVEQVIDEDRLAF
jgi:hypothetical protein